MFMTITRTPRMPIDPQQNVIDQAFEIFLKKQREIGAPYPDEVSFVGGFIACFGILTGKVDVGLDKDAPLDQIFDLVHLNIHDFGRRVIANQRKQDAMN